MDVSGPPPEQWGHVPARNAHSVGREDHLQRLRRLLGPAGAGPVLPLALHGMGGVGKSHTVAEYLHRHASEYEVVWWISAEQPAQIKAGFAELAERLDVAGAGAADRAVPAVLDALRRGAPYRRWILVFDNADRPQDVRRYFPAGNGHIVVTSRNSEWGRFAELVAVDVFTRAESIELLRRRAGDLDDAEADALADALGDLPLAVEQAAAWHHQTGMQVPQYLQLLEENRVELLEAGTSDDQLPVAAAWNVAFNELEEHHPAALQLLQLCAFFGPEPIPLRLFQDASGAEVPEPLATALDDPILLRQAIGWISRYSLAKIDRRANALQLHRLVQTVLKNRLSPEQQAVMRHAVHVLLAGKRPMPAMSTRLGFLVDVVQYGTRSRDQRLEAQHRLSDLVDAVIDRVGLNRTTVDLQEGGDSVLTFVGAEVDMVRTLPLLLEGWRELLRAYNGKSSDRVRLRMAIAAGSVATTKLGFVGEPAVTLGRLIDCQVLRDAVTDNEDADVVVLISNTMHDLAEVDRRDPAFLRRHVDVRNYSGDAWLWLG
ncbi:FxSxx-COOH system tetratricopeptide repeat protein [Saccharothrix saharensis]|uniref:FxSxx-COOH system tetratricopeptide repeat protein n=1 Tax=Saccharothrix saharensis TaxID=571190 RepID=UPI0036B31E75